MAGFQRFEEIEAWRRARELTRAVYKLSGAGAFARDFGLRNQICRACVSIMSNIAEGFERGGGREFVRFLGIAKGSTGEVRCQLYVALDQGYVSEQVCAELTKLAEETGRLIAGLMKYLRGAEKAKVRPK